MAYNYALRILNDRVSDRLESLLLLYIRTILVIPKPGRYYVVANALHKDVGPVWAPDLVKYDGKYSLSSPGGKNVVTFDISGTTPIYAVSHGNKGVQQTKGTHHGSQAIGIVCGNLFTHSNVGRFA
jgi:hypothetical protein